MDTSFLAPGPITWPALVACIAALWGLAKAADWALAKLKTGTREAVSPLTIDMSAAKIEIRRLEDTLNAFKVEVAQKYVTGDVISRLEHRIDDMVSSVRSEMKETRDAMLKAFMRRPE
ncbi:hypothetical protein [Methylobacterium oxalidis]|uniref:Uncharacterized protein n=1 Tax=Methylobacterium oxalidis TaxID=944322 RepID=A0A512J258_9HYPH|nr:hypothetical protein [Methylobacterium oxalidis]GEP04017.1 hypothetical protein MOX02_20550 [Methylobacterium oxalidis]GJE31522.1 hypothetical protein LDDCCGHA_1702 [Methylobacterium oxalidis]GLS64048.1 hypothetical protein GCM10007888_24290 [Methylobacterium oxalidis]